MVKTTKEKKPVKKQQHKSSSKALTAKQIVKRHIQNEKDIITEEDMRDVKIENCVPKARGRKPVVMPADKKRPKDEDKDPKMSTPWDVISE
jgi:hypothetical protein